LFLLVVQSLSTSKLSPPSSISSSSRRPSGPFQIKLRNPPVGRRLTNGTNTSNNLSSATSLPVNDKSQISDQPPPIPPRSSLLNTTNKRVEGQFVRTGEIPIKAKRTIFRSRNVKRREPTATTTQNARSDSADALSVPSPGRPNRFSTRRHQIQAEKGTNSD
jgi:hypothetical protein